MFFLFTENYSTWISSKFFSENRYSVVFLGTVLSRNRFFSFFIEIWQYCLPLLIKCPWQCKTLYKWANRQVSVSTKLQCWEDIVLVLHRYYTIIKLTFFFFFPILFLEINQLCGFCWQTEGWKGWYWWKREKGKWVLWKTDHKVWGFRGGSLRPDTAVASVHRITCERRTKRKISQCRVYSSCHVYLSHLEWSDLEQDKGEADLSNDPEWGSEKIQC